MTWEEADLRYGSDKPDLRFGLEIEEATEVTRGSEFKVFANAAAVRFLRVAARAVARRAREARGGRQGLGREGARLDRLPRRRRGALADREVPRRRSCSTALRRPGTTVLFGADEPAEVSRVLGFLRLHLGRELGLVDETAWRFVWVTDFPMFEWDPELERWDAEHHPFTRPNDGVAARCSTPTRARRRRSPTTSSATAIELAGGSFRIHEPELQAKVFDLLKISPEEQRCEVRLPARRARDGRAAARRDRLRDRPALHGAARRAVHPRHARVPEEPGRRRPDVRRADPGDAAAARRARHRRDVEASRSPSSS